jgi:hypothetical protein
MPSGLGYTSDLSITQLKQHINTLKDSFIKTNAFISINHFSRTFISDRTGTSVASDEPTSVEKIIELGDYATNNGVGIGGPDLFNYQASNGNKFFSEVHKVVPIYEALTPERIDRWSKKAPFYFGAMSASYRYANNVNKNSDGTKQARLWTIAELMDYGINTMKISFFGHHPRGFWSKINSRVDANHGNIHQTDTYLESADPKFYQGNPYSFYK